ncbi:MAG: hypothetical protein ACRD12_01770, partial [Acidimicrobiales bacterium]
MVREDVRKAAPVGPARPPRVTKPARPARRARKRNFWQRHFAFTAALLVTTLAVIVAFVATLVYAQVDAGRTITTEPSTVPRPPQAQASGEGAASTIARAPEILSEADLGKKMGASVRLVKTQDESGQPVEGSAFVVGSFGGQTLLLTSFAVVRAGTRAPAPPITLEGSRQVT